MCHPNSSFYAHILTCIHIDVDVSGVDDDADEGGVVVVAVPAEKLRPGVYDGSQT